MGPDGEHPPPHGGGPDAQLTARTAAALTRAGGGRGTRVTVIDPGAMPDDRRVARQILSEHEEELEGVETEKLLLEGTDVADTLVEASADYDLTVIGATRGGMLQRQLVGDTPHAVAALPPVPSSW